MKKTQLKDPIAFVEKLRLVAIDEHRATRLTSIMETLGPLVDVHANLSESRKVLSGSIGRMRKGGGDISALLDESKKLSSQLEQVNTRISTLIEEATDIGESSAATGKADASEEKRTQRPTGPGQFQTHESVTDIDTGALTISMTPKAHEWDQYVARNRHTTHYHQYAWRGIIERNFKQQCHYLTANDSDGHIVGIGSTVHLQSRVVSTTMLSMPFLIYGGPVADNQRIDAMIADSIGALGDNAHCAYTEIRETQPRENWHAKREKVAMVLELPDSFEQLNSSLGAKLRSQVKRAGREKPEFHMGSGELIPEFYAVFSRKMRDHGTPVYARAFFEDIVATFPQSTHIGVVRLDGKPVAAAFLVSYRDTLEIPWAASVRKFDGLGMNMYMYHSLLKEAINRQFNYFDFGRSSVGESTWKFKKQWGAKERQLYWHYQSNGKPYDPGSGTTSPKLALAMAIWKRLPVGVVNRIGPVLAKQLPW